MSRLAQPKRKDKNKVVLKTGEGQRPNGTYEFRWTDRHGNRNRIYAKTLKELREKETEIERDKLDGIRGDSRFITVNDLFDLWVEVKRGVKANTMQNYKYSYEKFIRDGFGDKKIAFVKKTDVKRFYNTLVEDRGLQISTIDGVHNVLHQLFDLAVDDRYIRTNPTDKVLKELKKTHDFKREHRRALTKAEQKIFLDFLRNSPRYERWYPIFAIMIGTGLRSGEVTGLRWEDIDLEEKIIDVNHTLVYFRKPNNGDKRFGFAINTPKSKAGTRQVPMLNFVKEAFEMEKSYQEMLGTKCMTSIDGLENFIFSSPEGSILHYGALNKILKRVIRDCNKRIEGSGEEAPTLLPDFSCHTLRHTFTTRMCEAGVNIKVIQDTLGHADISTTLNIYTDATKELKREEFAGLDKVFVDENMIGKTR